MPVINRIAEFHADMTAWRRDFHQHPELGLEEHRTAARVAALLHQFGVDEVHTGIATTGVVGVIRGQAGAEAIGMRADMDALPILEETGKEYASQTPGLMHACGHDGHTTMLLGAARYLAETRNFAGTVYLIFQPAEENAGGGQIMVNEGLFERFPMKQVYGMHNWPLGKAGTFGWRDGPMMAAVANIDITITGKGAHGAQPHLGTDPIVVSAAMIQSFQSIVARTVHPLLGGVVTIGSIKGGHTHNVIPETVRLLGTARWFEPSVGDTLERGVLRLAHGIAEGHGAAVDARFDRLYPATVNDPDAMTLARGAATAVAGEARVEHMDMPTMAGEDFSFMLNAKQGAYIMLGAGRGPDDAMVHHPKYDFNDDILPVGASYWATLAEQLLPRVVAGAMIVLLTAFTLLSPALAQHRVGRQQTLHRSTSAGTPVRVYTYVAFGRDCQARAAPPIVIKTPPGHGTAAARPGSIEVRVLDEGVTDCSGRVLPGTALFYTPDAGFHGTDQFAYDVLTGDNPRHDTAVIEVR